MFVQFPNGALTDSQFLHLNKWAEGLLVGAGTRDSRVYVFTAETGNVHMFDSLDKLTRDELEALAKQALELVSQPETTFKIVG